MPSFLEELKDRVLIFDGAMGTSIHKYDLSLDDYQGLENCPEILVESRPDVIAEIHESYFKAGCDAVETDTFGGSPVVLAEFGIADRAYELNKKAAALARQVADSFADGRTRYVSGSLGPTTKLPTLGHISFREMHSGYVEQVRGLVDGGVDVLQFETGQDLLQAKAAILAMLDVFAEKKLLLPIIAQVTIEAPPLGTMLVGSDIASALTTLSALPIDIIGLNCATGPAEMIDPVRYLCRSTDLFVSVLPNAGLPENIEGETVYKLTADELAASLKAFVQDEGVNIVGGCCGTTPEHLARVVEQVAGMKPKPRKPAMSKNNSVSSVYTSVPLAIENPPLIIGERTNTNGSRKFKMLLEKEDWDGMVSMAREQEREGAHVLDVCTAYVGRDEVRDMTTLIRRLNTEIQIPLVVDTTEYPVLAAALECITGKPIVNSINLEDGVESMMEKVALLRRFGAATIALTIDEEGMAKSCQRKVEIARRIFELATDAGMKGDDLIFDTLTFTLSTGNADDRRLGLETLEAIKQIKTELSGVRTVLGVSNISFGFDPHIRQIVNSVFLHYAVEYGLDLAIVNAQKILPLFKIPEVERELARLLIFDERGMNGWQKINSLTDFWANQAPEQFDPLFAMLDFFKSKSGSQSKVETNSATLAIEERLKQRIIDGDRVGLEKDLDRALQSYQPLIIINEFLLDGMKEVGDLFGAGKMQLPFVLQSAETMKASVSYLEKFMERVDGTMRGTLVLATVKGDVHDIGKNLVDIILSNNGYKVVNLGIKQPIENIVSAALEHSADCIGMSGLLVKSTVIMKENLEVLNQRGISTPVILGGAALTRKYVEEDCRKTYNGLLFYGQDAFDDLRIMEALSKANEKRIEPGNPANRGRESEILALVERSGANSATDCDSVNVTPEPEQDQINSTTRKKKESADLESFFEYFEPALNRESALGSGSIQVPEPPFFGSRIVGDISLEEIFPYINENVLFRGQWRVRQEKMSKSDFEKLIDEKFRPILETWKRRCIEGSLLVPRAVYGYFPCLAEKNSLVVHDHVERDRETIRFRFPRQRNGDRLCIADYFRERDPDKSPTEQEYDVLAMQLVTVGERATLFAQELFESDRYSDYLYFHGLAVETAEAFAEVMHKRIRAELGFSGEDAPDIARIFQQSYRGTRYSFGYPACPRLDDQELLFRLLEPNRIGVELTEEYQLVPEQSTSAIIVHHPRSRYFNLR